MNKDFIEAEPQKKTCDNCKHFIRKSKKAPFSSFDYISGNKVGVCNEGADVEPLMFVCDDCRKWESEKELQELQKKTYKVWELLEFPVGTEFKWGNIEFELCLLSGQKTLFKGKDRTLVVVEECYLNAEFTLIEKPVTFAEIVQAEGKRCRVEHSKFSLDNYYDLSEVLTLILDEITEEELRDIIQNGKWFIEGGN